MSRMPYCGRRVRVCKRGTRRLYFVRRPQPPMHVPAGTATRHVQTRAAARLRVLAHHFSWGAIPWPVSEKQLLNYYLLNVSMYYHVCDFLRKGYCTIFFGFCHPHGLEIVNFHFDFFTTKDTKDTKDTKNTKGKIIKDFDLAGGIMFFHSFSAVHRVDKKISG